MTEELDFENRSVLASVQALIGAIRPEIVAVAIESSLQQARLDLFVLVAEDTEEAREIIDEVGVDLAALLSGEVWVDSHLSVGDDWTSRSWVGHGKRTVFARSVEN